MRRAPLAVYTDTADIDPTPGVEILRSNGFEVVHVETLDADVIAAAAAQAQALLVGYAVVDEALLDRLPHLRIISLLSNGSDNVDIAAASRRGIWVSSVGSLASEEVATHAWALTLALLRRLPHFMRSGTQHGWYAQPAELPRRLSELTIGVLGLGSIGRRYARLAVGPAGRVLAADHGSDAHDIDGLERMASAEAVIAASDVLGVFLPLTPSTRGLVDRAALATMPRGAHLVNVSRGAIVDADALIAALDCGHLAGAALDVFDPEPPEPSHPLLTHPKVLTTPHAGYLSATTVVEYPIRQAQAVLSWWASGRPDCAINDIEAA